MKKSSSRVRLGAPASIPAKKIRILKKCLDELHVLYAEAISILNDLLVNTSAVIVRGLCARFHILQKYFAVRYREARAHAVSALGHIEAALVFP